MLKNVQLTRKGICRVSTDTGFKLLSLPRLICNMATSDDCTYSGRFMICTFDWLTCKKRLSACSISVQGQAEFRRSAGQSAVQTTHWKQRIRPGMGSVTRGKPVIHCGQTGYPQCVCTQQSNVSFKAVRLTGACHSAYTSIRGIHWVIVLSGFAGLHKSNFWFCNARCLLMVYAW